MNTEEDTPTGVLERASTRRAFRSQEYARLPHHDDNYTGAGKNKYELTTTRLWKNTRKQIRDQREEQWKLSGKIYKTQNFTQSAEGHKDGLWTTVISAAVLVLP